MLFKRRPVRKTVLRKKKATFKKLPVTAKALVREIKVISAREAQRELETKFVVAKQTATPFNSGINTGQLEMYSLIPALSAPTPAGTSAQDWERANNDITPMSCKTDWFISCANTQRSVNLKVDLYCLQSKQSRTFPSVLTEVGLLGPSFLKSGALGQVTNYTGAIVNSVLPVSIENFTLLKHFSFHLQKNVGIPQNDSTAGNAPNDTPSYKHVTFHYKCPKQFRYTPGVASILGDYPQGHAPFWVMGYSHVDGSATDLVNTDIVASWTTQMTFKDA